MSKQPTMRHRRAREWFHDYHDELVLSLFASSRELMPEFSLDSAGWYHLVPERRPVLARNRELVLTACQKYAAQTSQLRAWLIEQTIGMTVMARCRWIAKYLDRPVTD